MRAKSATRKIAKYAPTGVKASTTRRWGARYAPIYSKSFLGYAGTVSGIKSAGARLTAIKSEGSVLLKYEGNSSFTL